MAGSEFSGFTRRQTGTSGWYADADPISEGGGEGGDEREQSCASTKSGGLVKGRKGANVDKTLQAVTSVPEDPAVPAQCMLLQYPTTALGHPWGVVP
eukprot:305004-Rhodomonas_salina.3